MFNEPREGINGGKKDNLKKMKEIENKNIIDFNLIILIITLDILKDTK